jgi:hypothetical protein
VHFTRCSERLWLLKASKKIESREVKIPNPGRYISVVGDVPVCSAADQILYEVLCLLGNLEAMGGWAPCGQSVPGLLPYLLDGDLGHNWLAFLLQGLAEEVDHVGNDGLHGMDPHAQIDLVERTIWALCTTIHHCPNTLMEMNDNS